MCHYNCNGFNIHIIHASPHLFVYVVTFTGKMDVVTGSTLKNMKVIQAQTRRI